jgi:hypothetical protein
VVAKTVAADYCEQIFMGNAVKGVLEVKSEDTQGEVCMFRVCDYVPQCGCGFEYCVAMNPTILGGVPIPIEEWTEPLS